MDPPPTLSLLPLTPTYVDPQPVLAGRYVTGGYVSEEEAGERLAQTVYDPELQKSGNYWCWNGNAKQFGYVIISPDPSPVGQ